MNMGTGTKAKTGYEVLARGTKVRGVARGVLVEGKVVAAHLDPNRAPGIGRVSYDVETHPACHPTRVQAKTIEVVGETYREGDCSVLPRDLYLTGEAS